MGSFLDELVAAKRQEWEAAGRDTAASREDWAQHGQFLPLPNPRFVDGLANSRDGVMAIIAEFKRRAPGRRTEFPNAEHDPRLLAGEYERGHAAALSVVTEPTVFGGQRRDWGAIRSATKLPILRKDFIIFEAEIMESKAIGADAVLLIADALSDGELYYLMSVAAAVGLQPVIEVHSDESFWKAKDVGADVVLVNTRDLHTLDVNPSRPNLLRRYMPEGMVKIVGSGIETPADVRHYWHMRYDACLVGGALMSARSPKVELQRLMGLMSPPSWVDYPKK